MNKQFARIVRVLASGAALAAIGSAHAAGTDYSSITSAVDFSSVATGVLAIAALLAVPAVVKKGARLVLSMIK